MVTVAHLGKRAGRTPPAIDNSGAFNQNLNQAYKNNNRSFLVGFSYTLGGSEQVKNRKKTSGKSINGGATATRDENQG